MEYRADSLGLAGSVTGLFRDLIHQRLGLSYSPSQADQIGDRLSPLVVERGLTSFMDYYYLLKYASEAVEWERVMDALSVPETYFWREADQLRAVVNDVLPGLIEQAGGRTIRLWCVPCATGDEPLTIAMMLDERGWFDRADIDIAASDASPALVAKARAGVYGPRAFRNLSPALRAKYFTQESDRAWRVSPDLQRRIRYDVVNLMDAEAVARHAQAPVIFCRNVFIYFSDDSIRRAVTAFEASMPPTAYLCVGASESLLRLATGFELQEIGGAFIYVKGGADRPQGSFAVATRSEGSS